MPPHIYTSSLPSPPLPRQSIFHHLFPELDGACDIPPSTPTLIDGLTGKTLSREDVRIQAQRLAGGLHKLGLKRGDVVGVVGTNSLEWCNAVYGSLAGGLRVSPMNYA
jgi:acyl-CoA synthetase (AMP-forming)/AMP-acid ligase II